MFKIKDYRRWNAVSQFQMKCSLFGVFILQTFTLHNHPESEWLRCFAIKCDRPHYRTNRIINNIIKRDRNKINRKTKIHDHIDVWK